VNELQAIVDAHADARARGERAALATVVAVSGSAYRRPGARMLITESGRTVGAISGGCLERDVAERAAPVIRSGAARVVVYDTRGDEEIVWGLSLGCNGVVRVLLESLDEGSGGARALDFIGGLLRARKEGVIATLIDAGRANDRERSTGGEKRGAAHLKKVGASGRSNEVGEPDRSNEIGARLLFEERDDGQETGEDGQESGELDPFFADALDPFFADALVPFGGQDERLREDARAALAGGKALTRTYETNAGRAEIFFDLIRRARPVVVFGAEQDAVPVVRLARTLGWHVTVVDTRARAATVERFREADAFVLCRAEDVCTRVCLTRDTAAVVMTHNYLDDVELLRALLPSPAAYVGLLGPRQRTEKLLAEIRAGGGCLTASQLARLHGPVGIDIGAETPEEIALSVVAEIKAACEGRRAGYLRDRDAPIHEEHAAPAAPSEFKLGVRGACESAAGVACGLS
jgi:xanthine/CO dehydrogenase XdhC/CoxF family maturation factor